MLRHRLTPYRVDYTVPVAEASGALVYFFLRLIGQAWTRYHHRPLHFDCLGYECLVPGASTPFHIRLIFISLLGGAAPRKKSCDLLKRVPRFATEVEPRGYKKLRPDLCLSKIIAR